MSSLPAPIGGPSIPSQITNSLLYQAPSSTFSLLKKSVRRLINDLRCSFCPLSSPKSICHANSKISIVCSSCQEYLGSVDPVPAPRLVGIELNPGPKKFGPKTLAEALKQTLKTKQKNKRNRNKSKKLKVSPYWVASQGDTVVRAYASLLADPFSQKNMRTGFCTMTDTVLSSGYFKENYVTTAADDGFIVIVNPDAALSATSSTSSALSNALSAFYARSKFLGNTPTTNGTLLAPSTNQTSLALQMRCNRVVAGAVRVVISYPMTSSAPDITTVRLNGCSAVTALDSSTPNSVINLPEACTRTGTGGDITVQKNWLPSDPEDYGFSLNAVFSNGEGIFNPPVISGAGLPIGTRIFIEVIVHVEGMQGQQVGATTFSPQHDQKYEPDPSVSDAFSSPSHLWKSVKGVVHEASSAVEWGLGAANAALNVIDHAQSTLSRPRYSRTHGTIPSYGAVSEVKMIE